MSAKILRAAEAGAMIGAMRRLVRWMFVLGVLVGLVWAGAAIEVRGKTALGHALAWWKKQDFFTTKERPTPKKPAKKKEAARPAPAPTVEREATAKRVALLERAAEAIEKDDGNPGAAAKTAIGEKPSASQKKALDELVSSRVPRGR